MTDTAFYDKVDHLITTSAIQRLRDLGLAAVVDPDVGQFCCHDQYDVNSSPEAVDEALGALFAVAGDVPPSTDSARRAQEGYIRNANVQQVWNESVRTMADVKHFWQEHGFGAHLGFTVGRVDFDLEQLTLFTRTTLDRARLTAEKLGEVQLEQAMHQLQEYYTHAVPTERVRVHVSRRGDAVYRGGYTAGYNNRNGDRVYGVTVTGDMPSDHAAYALAHELGHVADFHAREAETSVSRVLFPMAVQEGLADYHARVALEACGLTGAQYAHAEEIALRLEKPAAMLESVIAPGANNRSAPRFDVVDANMVAVLTELASESLYRHFGTDTAAARAMIARKGAVAVVSLLAASMNDRSSAQHHTK